MEKTVLQTRIEKENEILKFLNREILKSAKKSHFHYYWDITGISPYLVKSIIERLEKAMNSVGIQGFASPIRGGTDGARLTFMGLPCPNIGTGGDNFHGPFEFVSLTMMKQSVEILKELIKE